MKKTLLISLLVATGAVQASTEDLIKDSHLSTSTSGNYFTKQTSSFGSSMSGITADTVSAWMSANMTSISAAGYNPEAVYASTLSGGNISINPMVTLNEETGTYGFTMINRAGYKGSVAGIATSITSDLSSVTGLTFSLDVTSAGSAGSSSLTLVYQTAENVWASAVTNFTATDGETATVSVDFGDDISLYSSTIYAVVATTSGYGSSFVSNLSLTATTASVPEPATASLSLLALGALALRRRRA